MTPRSKGRVTACTREEAKARLNQAKAFLDVAEMVLSDDQYGAHVAAALAVLAGIAASDAICGQRLGQWSRGPDHAAAVELLATVAVKDSTVTSKLKSLLSNKDEVHYSPRLITIARAKGMVREAHALLAEADLR